MKKTDKGFELNYYNLSYRRKFIRTLWCIPLAIFAVLLSYFAGFSQIVLVLMSIIFLVVIAVQAGYNYKKWKEEALK
jgi:lipopolysaccharide export LptBFGC system permease protein LptF